MHKEDSLRQRGWELENAFFRQEEERRLDALREAKRRTEGIEALRIVSAIDDDVVLGALYELGFVPASLDALLVYPLVMVAWADGWVDDSERLEIVKATERLQIWKSQPAFSMVEKWFQSCPRTELNSIWTHYFVTMDDRPVHRSHLVLRDCLRRELEGIARASGGFLGVGKISEGEDQMIYLLCEALRTHGQEKAKDR